MLGAGGADPSVDDRIDEPAVPVPILSRADADDPALVSLLDGAGLVYLSGGNPGYLAETLRGTLAWQRIVELWSSGMSVAGCSA